MQAKPHPQHVTYEDGSTIKNILVAIRDPVIAHVIADMVRASGHAPIIAGHASDAVQALATHRLDLVIVEATSSDRTALHLRNVLRAAWPHLPVVVLVEEGAAVSRGAPEDVGALGFVVATPIRGLILLAAIGRALARRADL